MHINSPQQPVHVCSKLGHTVGAVWCSLMPPLGVVLCGAVAAGRPGTRSSEACGLLGILCSGASVGRGAPQTRIMLHGSSVPRHVLVVSLPRQMLESGCTLLLYISGHGQAMLLDGQLTHGCGRSLHFGIQSGRSLLSMFFRGRSARLGKGG